MVGHTGTLFDPEIRIPAWIDAPPGALTPTERESLEHLETTPLTAMDVLPTLLDLMGVYDDPGVAHDAARAGGELGELPLGEFRRLKVGLQLLPEANLDL